MDGVLSVEEIRAVVEAVSKIFKENPDIQNEPIPPFETHDNAKLQGALHAPFQSAFGQDIYPTIYDKAAALFYFIAKDHAFENGNKRIAVLACLYYLAKNGLAIQVTARELYEVAVAVVESKKPKDEIVPGFAEALKKETVPLDMWLEKALEAAKKRKPNSAK